MNYMILLSQALQETSSILGLDKFTNLRSKSYSLAYNSNHAIMSVQKAEQKGRQIVHVCADYINSLFMSETTNAPNY